MMQAGAAKDKAAGATGGNNPIGNFIDEAKAGADRVGCACVMQRVPGVMQSPAAAHVACAVDWVLCRRFCRCHPAWCMQR